MMCIDIGERTVVHDGAQHPAEAIHCPSARLAIRRAEALPLAFEQSALQCCPRLGQCQQSLAAISAARRLRHVTALHQLAEHAGKRLLGDAQDAKKVGDRDARIASYEVQRTMVSTPEAQLV